MRGTLDGRRKTEDGRRETGDGRRETGDAKTLFDSLMYQYVNRCQKLFCLKTPRFLHRPQIINRTRVLHLPSPIKRLPTSNQKPSPTLHRREYIHFIAIFQAIMLILRTRNKIPVNGNGHLLSVKAPLA